MSESLRNWFNILWIKLIKFFFFFELQISENTFHNNWENFPIDQREQASRFLKERGIDPVEIFKKNF